MDQGFLHSGHGPAGVMFRRFSRPPVKKQCVVVGNGCRAIADEMSITPSLHKRPHYACALAIFLGCGHRWVETPSKCLKQDSIFS